MKISCRYLSKSFTDRNGTTLALDGVNFEVGEREFLCIVGPSGCGKTTLLNLIARLQKPTTGAIEFLERVENNHKILAALVFQEQGLFPWMTALENIAFGLEMQHIPTVERTRRAMTLIERFHLTGFEYFYPDKLSGGMRQRVAIARAFLADPEVLLMDEPFGALDAQTRKVLQLELLRVWKDDQKTVIYVTHDIEEAILLGDRVLVMSGRPGMILEDIHVPLDRPRDLTSLDNPDVTQLKWKIWKMLEAEAVQHV